MIPLFQVRISKEKEGTFKIDNVDLDILWRYYLGKFQNTTHHHGAAALAEALSVTTRQNKDIESNMWSHFLHISVL